MGMLVLGYQKQKFDNPESQELHDLYIWARTGHNPLLPYIEPKKRGVKKGIERGLYHTKKKKLQNRQFYGKICKECGQKFSTTNKRKNFCNNVHKQRYYRKKRLSKEIERKQKILTNL